MLVPTATAQPFIAGGGFGRPARVADAATTPSVATTVTGDGAVTVFWADRTGIWRVDHAGMDQAEATLVVASDEVRTLAATTVAGEPLVAWVGRDRSTGVYHYYYAYGGETAEFMQDSLVTELRLFTAGGAPWAAGLFRKDGSGEVRLIPLGGGGEVVPYRTSLTQRGLDLTVTDAGLWLGWLEGRNEQGEFGLISEWTAQVAFLPGGPPVDPEPPLGSPLDHPLGHSLDTSLDTSPYTSLRTSFGPLLGPVTLGDANVEDERQRVALLPSSGNGTRPVTGADTSAGVGSDTGIRAGMGTGTSTGTSTSTGSATGTSTGSGTADRVQALWADEEGGLRVSEVRLAHGGGVRTAPESTGVPGPVGDSGSLADAPESDAPQAQLSLLHTTVPFATGRPLAGAGGTLYFVEGSSVFAVDELSVEELSVEEVGAEVVDHDEARGQEAYREDQATGAALGFDRAVSSAASVAWSAVTIAGADVAAAPAGAPSGATVAIAWYGRSQGGRVEVFVTDDTASFVPGILDRVAAFMGWNPWHLWDELLGQLLTALLVGVLAGVALVVPLLIIAALVGRYLQHRRAATAGGTAFGLAPLLVVAALYIPRVAGSGVTTQAVATVAVALLLGAAAGWVVGNRGDREPAGTFTVAGASATFVSAAVWAFVTYKEWAPVLGLT